MIRTSSSKYHDVVFTTMILQRHFGDIGKEELEYWVGEKN